MAVEPSFRWEVPSGEEVAVYRAGPERIELGVGRSLFEKPPDKVVSLDKSSARQLAYALLLHSETLPR